MDHELVDSHWSLVTGQSGGLVGDFKDLHVWNEAYALTLDVYRVTRKFPREEVFGLTAQMRRASQLDRS
jgi:hypothetical protein